MQNLLSLAVFLLSLCSGPKMAAKITGVLVKPSENSLGIEIEGKDLSKPSTSRLGDKYVVALDGSLQANLSSQPPVQTPFGKLTTSEVGGSVHIVLRGDGAFTSEVSPSSKGWFVALRKVHMTAPATEARNANAGDPLCSLQVSEMDPAQILQTLSSQTGMNLVLLTKPDATLTINMNRVPLSEMVRHICAICDLSYLQMGRTYVIATSDRLSKAYPQEWTKEHPAVAVAEKKPEERVTETYQTGFSTASDMATTLAKLFKGKDVDFIAGPQALDPNIADQDSEKATGSSTSMLTQSTNQGNGSRLLVITGEKEAVAEAVAAARSLDKPRRQVAIAVTIHDISNDDLRDLGITWDFGTETFQESGNKGVNFGRFGRTPLSISTALSALDQQQKSKLLASPNISVLDGERAFVLIGDRISYPVLVGYSQNNAPIFSKEEEKVGIYLQVSAAIGPDGTITLSLYPQVSTITGYLNINGASYPQVSTREAQTTLMIHSGDTIVMGGLFSDEEIASMEKVPLLSQIPIIGEIFKHRKTTKTKSQVIITVTPTVIPQKS